MPSEKDSVTDDVSLPKAPGNKRTVASIEGEFIGTVTEVMRTGGVEVLVVENDSGREFLIPMAQEICVGIDLEMRLIRIDPPPGLLEL